MNSCPDTEIRNTEERGGARTAVDHGNSALITRTAINPAIAIYHGEKGGLAKDVGLRVTIDPSHSRHSSNRLAWFLLFFGTRQTIRIPCLVPGS